MIADVRAGSGGAGHRRVIRRELPAQLIDQIAPEIVGPSYDGRVVAIGQAGAIGRGRAVTGADVIGKVPRQRETSIDRVAAADLVIHPRVPGIEPRETIERAFTLPQDFEGRRIVRGVRGQSVAQIGGNPSHICVRWGVELGKQRSLGA